MHDLKDVLVITLSITLLIGAIILCFKKLGDPLGRLTMALLPLLLSLVVWNWYIALVEEPIYPLLSTYRLAPAAALTYGFPLYSPPDRGPVNGWVYPPLGVVAYLPAVVGSDPAMMVLFGGCLSVVYYFAPVAWLLGLEVRRGRMKPELAALLFAVFAIVSNRLIALLMASTLPHADAPALALGAVSLGLVGLMRGKRLGKAGVGAVLAAIGATFSKQVQAPLVILPALWLTATGGIRAGARALLITAALGLAILVTVALVTGPAEFVFNMWTVPSRHGFKFPTLQASALLVLESLRLQTRRPLLATLLCMVASLILVGIRRPGKPGTFREEPIWLAFLIGGCLEIPMAILGYLKRGADFDAESFAFYPLVIAPILVLGRCVATTPRLVVLPILLGLCLGVSETRALVRHLGALDRGAGLGVFPHPPWMAEERMVLGYLKSHPGEAYFPCHTLAHLVVEKRVYHTEIGVDYQEMAGYPPSLEQLHQYMPPRTRILCYPPNVVHKLPGFLGDDPTSFEVPELPGFLCFMHTWTGSAGAGEYDPSR
jgi:hypothetical protein